mgnify:CR=1 FL=1
MKTKKEVLSENQNYQKLINAVINRIGMDCVEDVMNHGADAGFAGFTYYSDTVRFFNTHKKQILELAENMADALGEDMLKMISMFNCLSSGDYKKREPDYSQNEIAQAIYQGKGEFVDIIKNAMSWFALEEVCRMFES